MATVLVLGAGIAGHTAAMHARRKLPKSHRVVVITPNANWNWIPSNIWVGVGRMPAEKVLFPLAPLYRRKGIEFHQALATEIHPEGNSEHASPFVVATRTAGQNQGEELVVEYDYLINCTGPKLNFGATPGLGPDQGHTYSVCTAPHAVHAAAALKEAIGKLKAGENLRFVIGTGHGTCTCEGAAFEYTTNLEQELVAAGVRDKAQVVYLTNEAEVGDFGVGGLVLTQQGYQTKSDMWCGSLFRERGIEPILGAHCSKIEPGVITYEQLDGSVHELTFDFAMLLPPFRGADLKAFDQAGQDISDQVFNPAGFMKVDANYQAGSYENWSAKDWPKTYQTPLFENVFAAGIAFAPPHQISKPRTTPNGTIVAPSPPRTGMPSGMIARAVTDTVIDRIKGLNKPPHTAPMYQMGAACVASTGKGGLKGSAAAMTMHPVVPDWEVYPKTGRDTKGTSGEIGLAGHWVKAMLHLLFIYKAKARPLWWLIPE